MTSLAKKAEIAKRRQRVIEMKTQGATYQQIADELGHASAAAACVDLERALKERQESQSIAVDEWRELELEKLDALERLIYAEIGKDHVTVSNGKVVTLDGEPVEDSKPFMDAVDRLLRIAERRAKLLGLDSPTKQQISGQLTYELVGVDTDAL